MQSTTAAVANYDPAHDVILATAGYDHTIRLWEALTGVCHRTIPHPDSQVNRLAISPDRRFLAACGFSNTRIYDLRSQTPTPLHTFDGHAGPVTGVVINQESTWMATSSEDGTVKVWDLRSPGVKRNYQHKHPVNDVCVHANQGEIISCDQGGSIRVWDLGENVCTHELVPEEEEPVRSVAVSADGKVMVAAGQRGIVWVWRMEQQGGGEIKGIQPMSKFQAHRKYLTRIALATDTNSGNGGDIERIHLATCSADSTVKLWTLDQKQTPSSSLHDDVKFVHRRTLAGHQRWVWDCAWSADAAYLVSAASDGTAKLWDVTSGEVVRQYQGHQKAVSCIALNDLTG